MTGEGVTDWSLPDADVIARAVGASCVVRKLEPELAWRSAGRTVRILAGAALKARLGCQAKALAPLLRVEAPELSPSMLTRREITTDDLLSVIEGMATARPVIPCVAPPKAEVVKAPAPAAPVHAVPTSPAPPPVRPRPTPRPAPRPTPPGPVRVERPRTGRVGSVIRLKPVTANIVRWARPALSSPLWTVDEVAELFGVHPDALLDAVAA